jgi:uncharacterized Fe-S cluster protein YjdI
VAKRIQTYENGAIEVTFDPNLCIHSARCLQGLPDVFDVRRRKWIEVDAGSADAIAQTIQRCPSGALQYVRKDGGAAELPDVPAYAVPQPNASVFVRGDLEILHDTGEIIASGPRFALCRCGESANKPFCDNTHRAIGFQAP